MLLHGKGWAEVQYACIEAELGLTCRNWRQLLPGRSMCWSTPTAGCTRRSACTKRRLCASR